ncbi:MAG: mannitol dehydrogenase family protein [Microthrixaceae bacterium]
MSGVRLPAYDRRAAAPGVVHLGLGAFARGHIAAYCDDLLALGEPAAITGVSLRSGSSTRPLADQDGLYTLIETDGTSEQLRVIGSVTALANGASAAVDAISASTTTAVTLTITEKGYHQRSGSGRAHGGINRRDPAVAHDLAHPDKPTTAPGVLVAALRRRRDSGLGGIAVISCDNLTSNGEVTAAAVGHLAAEFDADLAAWISEHVNFPSTVVDRIVPATTDADRLLVADRLHRRDDAPVRAETQYSWVIENVSGLPSWDLVGANLVDDVAPWEQRKLRTVNAPHSTLAYLGGLAGHVTINEAASDPSLSSFVQALLVLEVFPTLTALDTLATLTIGASAGGPGAGGPGAGDSAEGASEIARNTLGRFLNPLGHRCEQVAADGSQKLPQRVVEVIEARRAHDETVDLSALVVAAWISWVLRCRRGKARLVDPLAPELLAIASAAGSDAASITEAFLGVDAVFTPAVAADPVVRAAIARGLSLIHELGPAGAAQALTRPR